MAMSDRLPMARSRHLFYIPVIADSPSKSYGRASFGKMLKDLRLNKEYRKPGEVVQRPSAVAKGINTPVAEIQEWENGTIIPRRSDVVRYLSKLGIPWWPWPGRDVDDCIVLTATYGQVELWFEGLPEGVGSASMSGCALIPRDQPVSIEPPSPGGYAAGGFSTAPRPAITPTPDRRTEKMQIMGEVIYQLQDLTQVELERVLYNLKYWRF